MAYSEELAERIRAEIGARDGVRERKMFGGIAWMLHGNMACGTFRDGLLVRVHPDDLERSLAEPHVGPMTFTGRTMGGFVVVDADGIEDPAALARWIDEGASCAASLPPKEQ